MFESQLEEILLIIQVNSPRGRPTSYSKAALEQHPQYAQDQVYVP
jgi:hypothetical protein